jgi:uncharacterized protein
MAKRERPVTQKLRAGSTQDLSTEASSGQPAAQAPARPFWDSKTLDEMTAAEWESLCDGCGRCCLNKIEDEDTGQIFLTKVACKLLDVRSCQCRDYPNRQKFVPDCIRIDPEQVRSLSWLPETCGYRRVEEGRGLEWWHPLVSGSRETVHEAGISLRDWAKSERRVKPENFSKYLIDDFPQKS